MRVRITNLTSFTPYAYNKSKFFKLFNELIANVVPHQYYRGNYLLETRFLHNELSLFRTKFLSGFFIGWNKRLWFMVGNVSPVLATTITH